MLTRNQFEVLYALFRGASSNQRKLAEAAGLSVGTVNSTLRQLEEAGYLENVEGASVKFALTQLGEAALAPYKVDNAIIMAAGMSTRFAPISYEKPKGVLTVRGEVLIERQIRQLQEAGVGDIVVVVGYMKEEFFYLEDLLGVKIVVNGEYSERNNNSTIKRVEGMLGNTYICSSDDYFTTNPFEPYVYDSYYAAVYMTGQTDEWCLQTKGKDDLITGVSVSGSDSWVMLGHAYWSKDFSQKFVQILNRIYDNPETAPKLWEHIFTEHITELPPMHMKKYAEDAIHEFDSLDEVRSFDPAFIDNVDSSILDNICSVLECERADIVNIDPIKQGMTNLSFRFDMKGSSYVYRHPGYGSEEITNRKSETFSQEVARKLGIDSTFIFENPDEGWKISRFVVTTDTFDYHNKEHVREAMRIIRTLHTQGELSDFELDMHQDTLKQIALLDKKRRTSFKDFGELFELAERLNEAALACGAKKVLCHNDFYDQNFLVHENGMELIDWEYSGVSDYASDLAVFIACCPDYTYEDACEIFEMYFDRKPTDEELFHCVAYAAVVSFHWFVWALYQDMIGSPVGEFLYYYYRYTKMFGEKALEMQKELM